MGTQSRLLEGCLTRRGLVAAVASASAAGLLAACSKGTASNVTGDGSGSAGGDQSENDQSQQAQSDDGQSTDPVQDAMDQLSLEQKVAQLFVVAPEDIVDNVSVVVSAGDATKAALQDYPVGGFCYFGQNLTSEDQTTQMLSNVQRYSLDACGLVPFKAVDEEGGTVSRIGGNSGFSIANVGDMRTVGDSGDADQAKQVAQTIAGYLMDLGFNLDFAPVADIANNPSSTTMARRSFGTTADVVTPMVSAQVEGFAQSGIGCCAKHFPGIGGATGDSEKEAIYSQKTLEQMGSEELLPFQAAIQKGVPMVMVGHLSCPNVTGTDEPASLSKTMVTDVLRGRLGFTGICITDSLSMGAVSSLYDPSEIGVVALEAGQDMILLPSNFNACYQGVLDAVSSGRLTQDRIDQSVRRIVTAKLQLQNS
ncbi:MAG: glycoside hydrolase family 3 protein [Atopobiaceae bacterium]